MNRELTDIRMIPDPIPAKGQQGLWNWNDGQLEQLKYMGIVYM
ncbi:hypothetical protein [Paenibacillus sp. HGH0039]|nr:hypothetical protein [Paenibacillus sp. HGH0039]EPD80534.1 hypothetical protein HMPREF1207_05640 [Paenibacillus sp. HGH0039]